MKKLLLALVFIPSVLFSQSKKERKASEAQQKADQVVINNLKSHVQNLAGSKSNTSPTSSAAIDYISNQFKAIGLQPKGTNGFIQSYQVEDGKRIDAATYLKVNDKLLEVNKDYFPLSFSAEKKVTGRPAMALRERGVPWFFDVKDLVDDGAKTPGSKVEEVIKKEAAKVASKGATALFLYNSGSIADSLRFNSKDKSATAAIPVIYLMSDCLKKYFHDHSEVLDIELNTAFKESNIGGANVIGYIDNAAASTIVITAHYNPASTGAVENGATDANITAGADDNCSGVAMLIELARMLSASKAKGNNYLFLALGGNDKGSIAGNYWLENTTISAPVNYMFNVDMVGTYSDSKKLAIQGYNTSSVWKDVLSAVTDKKVEVTIDSARDVTDAQTSFYKKGIPELSFSSAAHADYTGMPDEEAKLNYSGELQIAKFISRLVEATDSKGKIAFAKIEQRSSLVNKAPEAPETKPAQAVETALATARAAVSLGVIPDRTASETGLKISGVSPKKLASKLGLQPGDVLTDLGTYKISDLRSYMNALSNFKAGDKTTLRIKRGKDDKEFAVEF